MAGLLLDSRGRLVVSAVRLVSGVAMVMVMLSPMKLWWPRAPGLCTGTSSVSRRGERG